MEENPLSSDSPQAQLIPDAHSGALVPSEVTEEIAAQTNSADEPVSASVSGPAMDEAAKQEFLWHTHQYLGEYARFGDTKAAFAGTLAAAILGGLYSAKAHVSLLQVPPWEWTISSWLTATGGLLLIASIALAVWTILPRLRSSQNKGFIYWGSIAAHGRMELLQTSFHAQSARTLNDHLLHHVFDISTKVCIPKYHSVYFCIIALALGGFLSVTGLVLRDVPHKASSPPSATAHLIVIKH